MLIKTFNILPKSFYFDQFIENTRKELYEECNYEIERKKQKKYQELLIHYGIEKNYIVPEVIDECSS